MGDRRLDFRGAADIDLLRLASDAHDNRHRRAVDIRVQQSGGRAVHFKRNRQIGCHSRFPDAPFAGSDQHNVLHGRQ